MERRLHSPVMENMTRLVSDSLIIMQGDVSQTLVKIWTQKSLCKIYAILFPLCQILTVYKFLYLIIETSCTVFCSFQVGQQNTALTSCSHWKLRKSLAFVWQTNPWQNCGNLLLKITCMFEGEEQLKDGAIGSQINYNQLGNRAQSCCGQHHY